MMYKKYNEGTIEVITGPMFSGKSKELIDRIKLLKYANIKTLVIKPKIDTRWNENKIISRCGSFINTLKVKSSKDILKNWNSSYKALAIDEAQFFDKNIIKIITDFANQGIRVLVSCLDQDSEGHPFGFAPQILAIAEHIDKLSAICAKCSLAASKTFKKTNSKKIIEIGDDKYEARCRNCFYIGQKNKERKEIN